MIDAAIATGDSQKVAAVVEIAKATNPDDGEEIDALYQAFRTEQRKAQKLAKEEELRAIRSAGLFEEWSGEGQVGASHSTGNTDAVGLNAALKLKREGIDWSHRVRATTDYQRNDGRTRREQYTLAYEPRFRISTPLFAYGLVQYERDRFQGYTARYAVSGGVGYKILDRDALNLSLKSGPAFRRTVFIGGRTEDRLAGLLGLDFDWEMLDGLTLSQDTSMVAETGSSTTVIVDSSNTTLNLLTGLQAKVNDRLSTRLSYQIEYDSNPPAGAVSTDTTSRFSLVYGF